VLREQRRELSRPTEMRAAHLIFLSIVCETVLIAACCHEQCSWLGNFRYRWLILIAFATVCFLVVTGWQYYILFNVDIQVITNPGPPPGGQAEE
jgi:hypothetical protein